MYMSAKPPIDDRSSKFLPTKNWLGREGYRARVRARTRVRARARARPGRDIGLGQGLGRGLGRARARATKVGNTELWTFSSSTGAS